MENNFVLTTLFLALVCGLFVAGVSARGAAIRRSRIRPGVPQYWPASVIPPPASPYYAMPPAHIQGEYPGEIHMGHKYNTQHVCVSHPVQL
jgi:hypothetical protein